MVANGWDLNWNGYNAPVNSYWYVQKYYVDSYFPLWLWNIWNTNVANKFLQDTNPPTWTYVDNMIDTVNNNAIFNVNYLNDGGTNDARGKLYYNTTGTWFAAEFALTNWNYWKYFIMKYNASGEYVRFYNTSSDLWLDYNYTNNTCVTISKKLYLQSCDLAFSWNTNYIYWGNWRYRNGAFYDMYNVSNGMVVNFNETWRGIEITNAYVKIVSNSYGYSTSYSWYGYVAAWGAGYIWGSSGTVSLSLWADHRLRCEECDATSWKLMKNHIKSEHELNYDELKWDFLWLQFNEYNFKNENTRNYIGLYADDLATHKMFKNYVRDDYNCDWIENVNLKCYINKIEEKKYKIITDEKIEFNNIKIKIYICETKQIFYPTFNNFIIELDLENDKYDIIILWFEQNIMIMNKINMNEFGLYILKQHLLEYEKDKQNIMNLINPEKQETTKQSKNMINEATEILKNND